MSQIPTPNRKRRRWIVATAIAIAAFVWWLWPRADARFVGRWAAYNNTNSFNPICFIELRSNGRGHTVFSDGSPSDDFFWSVEGGELRTGLADGPIWQTILRQFFARLWMKLTNRSYMQGVHRLRVEKVGENEIRLMSDDGDWIVYRRVPSPGRGDTD
jgi:hypothetical protein